MKHILKSKFDFKYQGDWSENFRLANANASPQDKVISLYNSFVVTGPINKLSTWLLIQNYECAGIKFTAKQNKVRCLLHFFPPFLAILFLSMLQNVMGYGVAIIWVIYVVNLELIGIGMRYNKPQRTWQLPIKTRSDLITKIGGAVCGLIGVML